MNKKTTKDTTEAVEATVEEKISQEVEEASADSSQSPLSVMSGADSEVAGLAKAQPSFDQLEKLYTKTRGRIDLLALPEECEALQRRDYRFKWLAKDKHLTAKLKLGPWVLCTRTTAPFIKKDRFGVHGALEQAGMLLGFTTERLAQLRERTSEEKNAKLLKHYTEDILDQEGFYKPKDSGGDEASDDAFVEGRDF